MVRKFLAMSILGGSLLGMGASTAEAHGPYSYGRRGGVVVQVNPYGGYNAYSSGYREETATAITTSMEVMVCREATSTAPMAFLVQTTMADTGPALVDSKVGIKASMEARRLEERTELVVFRRAELTVLGPGFRSGSVDSQARSGFASHYLLSFPF